jgi:hypothetical protein
MILQNFIRITLFKNRIGRFAPDYLLSFGNRTETTITREAKCSFGKWPPCLFPVRSRHTTNRGGVRFGSKNSSLSPHHQQRWCEIWEQEQLPNTFSCVRLVREHRSLFQNRESNTPLAYQQQQQHNLVFHCQFNSKFIDYHACPILGYRVTK